MAYVENLSAFLLKCIEADERYAVFNYVDKPDFTMNELVSFVRGKLRGRATVGIRIPKFLGLMFGYLDVSLKLGVKTPIQFQTRQKVLHIVRVFLCSVGVGRFLRRHIH